jgi:hypothetical protein
VNSRKKILIVAGNVSHLDQFVIHGFFKELAETASIYLTLPEQGLGSERWVEMATHLDGVFTEVLPYTYSTRAKTAGYQLGEALAFHFRNVSIGYSTRLRNKFLIGLGIPVNWKSSDGIRAIIKHFDAIWGRFVKEIPTLVRGTKVCFWFWKRFAVFKVLKNSGIGQVLKILKPDVVIVLMQRQAGFVVSALHCSEEEDIPTLLLPVKWDNASSKSPLIKTPNRMLVYNNQVGSVCSRLHRMARESIVAVGSVEVGTGRLNEAVADEKLVVLIGSTSDASSSGPWLSCVNSALKNFSVEDSKKIKVVWRPYPTADQKSLDFMQSFAFTHQKIKLDSDIAKGISHRSRRNNFSETIESYERYCNLVNDAHLVVSEGTSAIVDSRARGVPVVVPAFKRNAVIGSQWYLINGFEHSQGLKTTKGVFIAEDEEELKRLVVDFLENPRRIPPDNSGENIFVDERTYAQRVLDVIDDAIAEKSKQRD